MPPVNNLLLVNKKPLHDPCVDLCQQRTQRSVRASSASIWVNYNSCSRLHSQ